MAPYLPASVLQVTAKHSIGHASAQPSDAADVDAEFTNVAL